MLGGHELLADQGEDLTSIHTRRAARSSPRQKSLAADASVVGCGFHFTIDGAHEGAHHSLRGTTAHGFGGTVLDSLSGLQ